LLLVEERAGWLAFGLALACVGLSYLEQHFLFSENVACESRLALPG
jgi:hypothetical protein